MKGLGLVFKDRRRRQRGSVLSGLLIIIAFLAIVVGSIMSELTSSFLVSRTLVTRVQREATVTSAVEVGIHQLQSSAAPAVCAHDGRGPWFASVNGLQAVVTQSCTQIVPDLSQALAGGSFSVDGIHDTTTGRDRYLVGDASGRLYSYAFGQAAPIWSITAGGALTAPPTVVRDSSFADLLVPISQSGGECSGHCVAVFDDRGGAPAFRCNAATPAVVRAQPGAETAAGTGHFPNYGFVADSGGGLSVFNVDEDSHCVLQVVASLDGTPAGQPLVFPGTVTSRQHDIITSDEVFIVVTGTRGTMLEHWRYSEVIATDKNGNSTITLGEVGSLAVAAGPNAVGYAASSNVPSIGARLMLAVASASGGVALATITVGSGPTYSMSPVASAVLPGGIARAPYWCHCPGQDLVGVGSTNGVLYILDTNLGLRWLYDGQANGRPAIVSTPQADANGDWYFGADDGYVYDVEVPAAGQQMFNAARFGPGGAIRSSPIVGGAANGCSAGPCLYFASSGAGSYFVQLGSIRIMDLRACVSAGGGSTACVASPRLWARVEVGSPSIIGGSGVYVQAWSYYTP